VGGRGKAGAAWRVGRWAEGRKCGGGGGEKPDASLCLAAVNHDSRGRMFSCCNRCPASGFLGSNQTWNQGDKGISGLHDDSIALAGLPGRNADKALSSAMGPTLEQQKN